MIRAILVTVVCGGVVVAIGMFNIWLGILAAFILYELQAALLRK